MTTAICPGSFDPVTVGHVDIIRRARKMFDHVIVAVLVNPTKNPSFSLEERIGLLKRATKEIDGLEIVGFDGLLADYARTRKATVLVKGLRAVSDFEYEFQMSLTNKKAEPGTGDGVSHHLGGEYVFKLQYCEADRYVRRGHFRFCPGLHFKGYPG